MLFAIFDRKKVLWANQSRKRETLPFAATPFTRVVSARREISDAWEPIRLIKEEEIEDGLSWHYNAESIGGVTDGGEPTRHLENSVQFERALG